MKTTALEVLAPAAERQVRIVDQGDEMICLRDFGPHVTELIRELVTHVELLKEHVDTMYSYCEIARRSTFASRQAAIDLVRFAFVFPRVLHEFGSVLQVMDAIRFGEGDPKRESEI